MKSVAGRFSEPAFALLRVVAGLLFAFHGVQKIFGILGGQQPPMFSQIWFAGAIELVGGVLIVIGLFTRLAAFICSGEMAAAYFLAHAPKGIWPAQNGGELSALYAFLFLYIAARGGGRWSIDRR